MRRRLEAERDGDGPREYIKVLPLLEKHSLPELRWAVEQALAVDAITRDAVAQFLYPREDWCATLFSLDGHPHLRHVHVAAPNLASYMELVAVRLKNYFLSLRCQLRVNSSRGSEVEVPLRHSRQLCGCLQQLASEAQPAAQADRQGFASGDFHGPWLGTG